MRRFAVLALAIVAAAAGPAAALPQPAPVTIVVAEAATYVPGWGPLPLEIAEGAALVFVNVDPVWSEHSVVADDFQADGATPLFASRVVDNPGAASVEGAQDLPPGTYPFHCSIHGWSMTGTLTVTPRG